METATNRNAISTALAIAADDPSVGVVELRKGWKAEVTRCGQVGADRQVRVWNTTGSEAVLTRFVRSVIRPQSFPESIGFVSSEVVWAGESNGWAAAVWIAPADASEVAASVVTMSVQMGWDLESATQLVFPRVKSVSMTRGSIRRAVSIISKNVVLGEGVIKS